MLRVVLTGGPGSGKSTTLGALVKCGFEIRSDSARTIITRRKAKGLSPRPEPAEFAQEIITAELSSFQAATTSPTFFERGVVDALGMAQHAGVMDATALSEMAAQLRYCDKVFLFPPWQEIYVTDAERDQTLEEAAAVYRSTLAWYPKFGYDLVEVPFGSPENRAKFILAELG
ncbi:MAG: putative ATPase [Candidatus Azotimanducaceae bacterium]|jgi:predicted ATPase